MKKSIFNKPENRQTNGVTTRQIVLSICFIAFTCACFAQDMIVTRDSRRIAAKVTEINVDNIRYRLFDNLEGPLYTMSKNDVVSITFQNGLTQTFTTTTSTPVQTTSTPVQTTQANTQTRLASTQTAQPYNPAYNSGQRRLTTAEKLREMQINYPALFSQYNAGRSMKSAGWALTGIGIGATVLGAAIGVAGEENYDDAQSQAGAVIMTGGIILVATGIPILAVGAGKRRRALRAFDNQYYAVEKTTPQFQFNVYPNSVGLAYVF